MPRLPGLNLQDHAIKAQLSVDDRLGIARAVARMLVEIQAATWEYCGSYNAENDQVKPYELDYRARVVQTIREKVNASCQANNNTTHADVQYIESILTKTQSALQIPFQPGVVLADYGEHNLVVSKSGISGKSAAYSI